MYESSEAFANSKSRFPAYGVAGLMNPQTANLGKTSFVKGPAKMRLNAVPIVMGIILPCALFSLIFALLSLEVHFTEAEIVNTVVAVSAVLLFLSCVSALTIFRSARVEREPTWVFFILASAVVAWIMAVVLGSLNYKAHTKAYLDLAHMRHYKDVSPETMRGQQLMDAGRIDFTKASILDRSKAMAFKNDKTYCVAPITAGSNTTTYDFWAVGVNCCNERSGTGVPSFDCPHSRQHSLSGARFMGVGTEDERAFFRLAVQQAEATFSIKAAHPVFLELMMDMDGYLESLRKGATLYTILGIIMHFVLQTFAVLSAVLVTGSMRTSV